MRRCGTSEGNTLLPGEQYPLVGVVVDRKHQFIEHPTGPGGDIKVAVGYGVEAGREDGAHHRVPDH